ncbi:efflux RND transporter periplasmic adaptor subunit [Magnetovibrio sp.]|uniref:efflux RND transporter periplasmic adaptor subunit n=1 Tax=Magnetovibrio sp. TaxID=2024836 RepID=UPI002F951FD8
MQKFHGENSRLMRRVLWFLPPIAAGVAIAAYFILFAPEPGRTETVTPSIPVRIATAVSEYVRPIAIGWGNARAAETWASVSEVNGRIIYRHPDLETGRLIAAGTKVLEIDPADYELSIRQAAADLAVLTAEAGQLDIEEANTRSVLALEQARLKLSEKDLARTHKLVAQGTSPQVRGDEQERMTLQIRRTVAELQNTLALIPARREGIAAQVARTRAGLARSQRDLANTAIIAPFDLRVRTIETERFQYVNTGQRLVTGDSVDRAEVVAQVPFDAFLRLIGASHDGNKTGMVALREGPAAQFEAEVRLVSNPNQVWQGKVSRIEGALDPRARSVQVVVSVENPYAGASLPDRLPLVPNMYLEVKLTGMTLGPQVVVPEAAVHHGDTVYVRDVHGRLEIRPVTVAFRQQGRAVISNGLVQGEALVLDDLAPAIPGMSLAPLEARP